MTGGIADGNISQIMGLRQGNPPMGWGEIARSLGLSLGKVVSAAESVKGSQESASARENAAGAGSPGAAAASGHMASGGGRGGR